jgi:hypothetical protein
VTGAYQFQRTRLFDIRAPADDEAWLIDRLFPQIRLSKFSGTVFRDSRNPSEALDPSHGTQLSATADLAARAIGSEVGFIKTYFTGFLYRQLPVPRRVVVVLGARVGMARGFNQEINGITVNGLPATHRFAASRSIGSATRKPFRVTGSRPAAIASWC